METLEIKQLHSEAAPVEAAKLLIDQFIQLHFFQSVPNCLVLSGGSCIDVASAFVQNLPTDLSVEHTKVLLADERWVEPGSDDSNEQQLRDKGVIQALEARGAEFMPILGLSSSPQTTVEILDEQYRELLSSSKCTVLLAGVGPDGHTAGMLPEANADTFLGKFSSNQLLTYYQLSADQDNPFRERITITVTAVSKIHAVTIFAVGENKHSALDQLKKKSSALHQTPALGLYLTPGPLTLITDLDI